MEPYVLWTAEFLTKRRDCYRATDDPRLAVAQRDLEDFVAHESFPLVPGRSCPATAATA